MSKNPIRDKLGRGKDEDKERFEHLRNAMITVIKGILTDIKKNYELEMNITCKIAGIGTVATFEFLKSEIEEEEEEETEASEKIIKVLKEKVGEAKERIIKLIEAKSLTNLTLIASTESIPYLSWISDVEIEVIIKLIK